MSELKNKHNHRLKLIEALKEFQNQIENIASDLNSYKLKPNSSTRYIYFKEQQIKTFQNILECFIEFQENATAQLIESEKKNARLNKQTMKLEGICLIHGISNFDYFLRMNLDCIIKKVQQCYLENLRETPNEIRNLNSQGLEVIKTNAFSVQLHQLKETHTKQHGTN